MTFKEFVKDRMEPLEAMPVPFGNNTDAVLRAMLNWLVEAAGIPPDACKAHAQDWLAQEGAKRVNAVCGELASFFDMPLMPTVRAVWNRLYPPADAARKACEHCDGTGWIIVQGPHGTSAAYPCTHQPETDADRRMGVQIHPAVAAHYREEAIRAQPRRELWEGSGGKSNAEALKRIMERV